MSSQVAIEYTIYFAGGLFDHKELIGNAILSSYIDSGSGGQYRCVLPQNLEDSSGTAVDIRNQDLSYVMSCDLAIFNFDGTELDSGTVVEFMYAKTLDIPSVIIRSDFRGGGGKDRTGDQWNLMASFYPRTRKLTFNSMEWYQREKNTASTEESIFDTADKLYKKMAKSLITELDAVILEPPLLSTADGQAFNTYRWATVFPGHDLRGHINIADLDGIIIDKKSKGLIA